VLRVVGQAGALLASRRCLQAIQNKQQQRNQQQGRRYMKIYLLTVYAKAAAEQAQAN
jgi:hypothetical protein